MSQTTSSITSSTSNSSHMYPSKVDPKSTETSDLQERTEEVFHRISPTFSEGFDPIERSKDAKILHRELDRLQRELQESLATDISDLSESS